MATMLLRALAAARITAGAATILMLGYSCSFLGVPTPASALILCQLVGARELALGSLLWPNGQLEVSKMPSAAEDSPLVAPSLARSPAAGQGQPHAARVIKARHALASVILVDSVDVALCAYGWIRDSLSVFTVTSLGAIGLFGIVCSLFALRMLRLTA